MECLTLTVEEVMHIRQVLVKAELEKFQQYKEVYNALKKGKVKFACGVKMVFGHFHFSVWGSLILIGFSSSSSALHVEPKSSPSSPGPIPASSAKGKLKHHCWLYSSLSTFHQVLSKDMNLPALIPVRAITNFINHTFRLSIIRH